MTKRVMKRGGLKGITNEKDGKYEIQTSGRS